VHVEESLILKHQLINVFCLELGLAESVSVSKKTTDIVAKNLYRHTLPLNQSQAGQGRIYYSINISICMKWMLYFPAMTYRALGDFQDGSIQELIIRTLVHSIPIVALQGSHITYNWMIRCFS
jgi:hypothetical protein